MIFYPKASFKGDGQSGGSFISGAPRRLIFHTTETEGIPGYNNGASSPHLTYYVQKNRWVQHTEFNTACRALRNAAGGVQTNRQGAIQVEIVCYSDGSVAAQKPSRLWVGNLPEYAYRELAEFAGWVVKHFGVQAHVRWPRPPARYGVDSPSRMGSVEWNNFNGFAGHFEVPENTHWDPGVFNFVRLLENMKGDDDTVEFILSVLQAQNMAFYRSLQAKTGTPGGDPNYWGNDYAGSKPSAQEWVNAAPVLFAAIMQAAAQPSGSLPASEIVQIVRG